MNWHGLRLRNDMTAYPACIAAGASVRFAYTNAAGASVFRVALGGHQLTVTHTDGIPIEPVVDTVHVAPGERHGLQTCVPPSRLGKHTLFVTGDMTNFAWRTPSMSPARTPIRASPSLCSSYVLCRS